MDQSGLSFKIKGQISWEIHHIPGYEIVTIPEEYFRKALNAPKEKVLNFVSKITPETLRSLSRVAGMLGMTSGELSEMIDKLDSEEGTLGISADEIPSLEREMDSTRKTSKKKDEWRRRLKGGYQADSDIDL